MSGSPSKASVDFKRPNICHYNVEPDDTRAFAERVIDELGFFSQYISKAIDNVKEDKYGMRWQKDERIRYRVTPKDQIIIYKPERLVRVRFHRGFDEDHPVILKMKSWDTLKYTTLKSDGGSYLITLDPSEDLDDAETLMYKKHDLEWEHISRSFDRKVESVQDQKGNVYKLFNVVQLSYGYQANLGTRIPDDSKLYVNGLQVRWEKSDVTSIARTKFHDKNGKPLGATVADPYRFIIECTRKIEGFLEDDDNRRYDYREEGSKGDGVWIILKDEDSYEEDSEGGRGKLELFFEILSVAIEREVWEAPRLNFADKSKKIRILRADAEEARLLLEREPTVEWLYPPNISNMLYKQRDAINTLRFYPRPDHRGLLRLLETADVQWDQVGTEYNRNNVGWVFLNDERWPGTDEQRDFVLKALNTPDFAILEGPPGSGKTTTISEIIYQILTGTAGSRPRILLCASTHVAVDNVIQKLHKKFGGEKQLLEAGIVPLRIGRDDDNTKIDDVVQNYRIDKRVKEYRQHVENEEWFKGSSPEEQDEYLKEMVINCSNLVCGTTFGILQYPRFKTSRGYYTAPEFDYLIIDEASKTTFQDFLVPAIYAKKWVLVGDVMQLSPFTDTLHTRVNLDGLLDKNREKAHIAFLKLIHERTRPGRDYKTGKPVIPPRFVYVDTDDVVFELGKLIISKLIGAEEKSYHKYLKNFKFTIINNRIHATQYMEKINVLLLKEEDIDDHVCALYDQDIILVPKGIYNKGRERFPSTHILVNPGDKGLDMHDFRHLDWTVWAERNGRMYTYDRSGDASLDVIKAKLNDALCSTWADQLSWRMKRVFELQMSKKRESERSSYNRAFSGMMTLLPDYSDDPETRRIIRFVNKLRSIAFPSILTSLQEGFKQDKYLPQEDQSILSQGLPADVKAERYTRLLHQYRMHSEIARIPRDLFYDGKALQQGIADTERLWNNPYLERYPWRIAWINCQGRMNRNTNDDEVRLMLSELSTFRENLRRSGKYVKDDGTEWEVLLLSFYKPQRNYIAEQLKKTFPENNNHHRFTRFLLDADHEGKHKIHVYAYTVDNVQGKENDIVFLSMVRREGNSIGFLDSPNRLNVAITRARYQLVIFGDKRFYERQNDYSHELSFLARNTNQFNPDQGPIIQSKTGIRVKG